MVGDWCGKSHHQFHGKMVVFDIWMIFLSRISHVFGGTLILIQLETFAS
jgi:hypothetical protein